MVKKRGFVLIGSIFLVLFLGIFLSLALMRSQMQVRLIDTRKASLYAFNAAEAGLNSSLTMLRSDASWAAGYTDEPFMWDNAGTSEQVGFYTVSIVVDSLNPSVRWILSTGKDINKSVTRVLRAKVVVLNPGSFFASSMSGITIGSGATIEGDLYARDIVFDVNEELTDPALRRITVNASVEYTRSLVGANNPDVVFNDGQPVKTDPITFTGLDLTRYEQLAALNGRVVNGDFSYSGELTKLNLAAPNGLVYVNGDAHISGSIIDSLHIVATGNIYIDNNIVAQSSGGVTPQLGLSAGNDVIIPASAPTNLSVEAFIFADGGVFKAEEAATQKGTLNFNGSISVRGRDNADSAINLNAYGNRVYHYNSDLMNMQIPFMNYFVNLIDWKEVKSTDPFPPAQSQ